MCAHTHTQFGVVYCQWELAFSYTCHPSSQSLLVSKLSIQSRLKSMTDWAARWTFSNHWFHHGVPVHKHPQQLTLAWNGDHIPQAGRHSFWWMYLNLSSFQQKQTQNHACLWTFSREAPSGHPSESSTWLHAFLPAWRSDRLYLGGNTLNGKEEVLTACLGQLEGHKI